jgi:hypothetical protein
MNAASPDLRFSVYAFECSTERIHDLKRAMKLLRENYMGEGNAAYSALDAKLYEELFNLKELAAYIGEAHVAEITERATECGIDVASMMERAKTLT